MIVRRPPVRRKSPRRQEVVRRAEKILRTEPQYIYHVSFDEPQASREILGADSDLICEVLGPRGQRTSERSGPGLDFYVAFLYRTDPLTREQEFVLFRRMNYLKFRAHRARQPLNPKTCSLKEVKAIEQLEEEAGRIRNYIVESNLRLVTARAKQFARTTGLPLDELISEGNIGLVQAVEHFDFARGTKLSTYATWAITNKLLAYFHRARRQAAHFVNEPSEALDAVDAADVAVDEQLANREVRSVISSLLDRLKERERLAVVTRFGLTSSPESTTLKDLAVEWGVTKQRAQQVCASAITKLRTMLREAGYAPTLD